MQWALAKGTARDAPLTSMTRDAPRWPASDTRQSRMDLSTRARGRSAVLSARQGGAARSGSIEESRVRWAEARTCWAQRAWRCRSRCSACASWDLVRRAHPTVRWSISIPAKSTRSSAECVIIQHGRMQRRETPCEQRGDPGQAARRRQSSPPALGEKTLQTRCDLHAHSNALRSPRTNRFVLGDF